MEVLGGLPVFDITFSAIAALQLMDEFYVLLDSFLSLEFHSQITGSLVGHRDTSLLAHDPLHFTERIDYLTDHFAEF
jgi:hypothetical protein